MEIEATHRAVRHQAGGFDFLEVVHPGDTPIGPHINLLRFCSNAWKLIAGLMVDAAVNHECSNLNHMGNCGNFGLVCYRQGITQPTSRTSNESRSSPRTCTSAGSSDTSKAASGESKANQPPS